MRRAALSALVAVVVGCANEGQPQGQANSAGIDDTSAGAVNWTTQSSKSGIDGKTHTASRIYEFADRQTQFQVAASCVASTGVTELTVDSFIGDPQSPKDGSAFLVDGPAPQFMAPVGRAKASDKVVTELGTYFIWGEDYNNRIKFNFNNPIARKIISEAPGFSAFASTFEEGDVNYASLLLAVLPMTIQVKNGAGDFELDIDKSAEVVAVLQGCGAGGRLLSAKYLARAKAAEQSARDEVIKNLRSVCSYRGRVRDTSELWIETAKSLSVPLDCSASAPDELAVFDSKINAYLRKAQELGISCSRDALLQEAAEIGLDEFLWENNLENYCRS